MIQDKERRRKHLAFLLRKEPMSISQIMKHTHTDKSTVFRDLDFLCKAKKADKRYCHWKDSKKARWIYFVKNEVLENMDDEFTARERIEMMLEEGMVISYLNESIDVTIYQHIKKLRKQGWQIGERQAANGRHKEFFLLTKKQYGNENNKPENL